MSLTTLIGFFGALQGVVLAGAVASLGGPTQQPNRALSLMLLVLSVSIATIVADHAGPGGETSVVLTLIEYTFALLFPPMLWYYTNLVLGVRSRIPLVVHFLPAAVWLGYLILFGLDWAGIGPTTWRALPPILSIVIYQTLYTIAVAVRTRRRAFGGQALVSHRVVLIVIINMMIVLHISQFIRYYFNHVSYLSNIVPITATFIIYILSILAVRQSRLFAGYESPALRRKYEASSLTSQQAESIGRRLLLLMDREKPFMNENLNLAELASRLAVPRAHVSQVINANLESNFPEFLNEYRVREAIRLLKDPASSHLTIEAIGYEVGFRSRSGFYSAFKRITGETPTQTRTYMS